MLRCDGEHRVRRAWHFAEDCQVERVWPRACKVTSGLTQVFFEPLEALDSMRDSLAAASAEQGGWVSRSFGRKQRHDQRSYGIRASTGSPCCARASPTRGHATLASEPAISRSRPAPGRDGRRAERASARMSLRHDDCFGLFNEIGDIDAETRSEAGLYRGGVRHLSRLTLTIAGQRPLLLAASAARGQRPAHDESHQRRRARRGRPYRAAARHAAHHALALHLGGRLPRDDPRAQFRAEHRGGGAGGALRLAISRTSSTCARSAASTRRARASSAWSATA